LTYFKGSIIFNTYYIAIKVRLKRYMWNKIDYRDRGRSRCSWGCSPAPLDFLYLRWYFYLYCYLHTWVFALHLTSKSEQDCRVWDTPSVSK